MASAAAVLSSDDDHIFFRWDRVVGVCWRGTPHARVVAATNLSAQRLAASSRDRLGFLMIVEPQSPIPDTAARRELTRLTSEIVPAMAIGVAVAEGGGFRTATVRSVGIALTTLAPHRMPLRFVDSVESAGPLLAPHLSPTSGGPAAMVKAIADLRASLARQPAR